jgi:hypothetical protein
MRSRPWQSQWERQIAIKDNLYPYRGPETNTLGSFEMREIYSYPGRGKLIVPNLHEATFTAFTAYEYMYAEKSFHTRSSTTSQTQQEPLDVVRTLAAWACCSCARVGPG